MAVDTKTIASNTVAALIAAIGLFSSVLLLSNSWLKILLLTCVFAGGALWWAARGSLKRALKIFVLAVLIFGMSFVSFERYVYWNAGYPPTYSPSQPAITISYPAVLNTSLADVVQNAEKTVVFNLFQLQHPGGVTFESIMLDSLEPGGRIEVTFYNEAANTGLGFISSRGYQYHASNLPWIGKPPSRLYSQQQPSEETLKQIDNLGLQYFLDLATETYQNRTGANPSVASLQISTQWQHYGDYQGIILQMIAWRNIENGIENAFNAAFEPNGTLLYLTIPN